MNRLQETLLICSHELRRMLRTPKAAILLLLYALVASLSGLVFVHVSGVLGDQLDAHQMRSIVEELDLYRKTVGLFFGDEALALDWLLQMPPFLLFFYKFNLFFLPALVVLMGFDQVSGELAARSLRYLAPRAHRSSILLGKVLAELILLVALTGLMGLGAVLFTRSAPEASWGVTLLGMLRFEVLTIFVMLAYLGLVALFSTLTRTPLYALVFAFCALILLWLVGALGSTQSLSFLRWFAPATYEPSLLSAQALLVVRSVAAYLAFTALFLGGALFRLNRADL